MPAIGDVWIVSTWHDDAWEANTWGEAIDAADFTALETITLGTITPTITLEQITRTITIKQITRTVEVE